MLAAHYVKGWFLPEATPVQDIKLEVAAAFAHICFDIRSGTSRSVIVVPSPVSDKFVVLPKQHCLSDVLLCVRLRYPDDQGGRQRGCGILGI